MRIQLRHIFLCLAFFLSFDSLLAQKPLILTDSAFVVENKIKGIFVTMEAKPKGMTLPITEVVNAQFDKKGHLTTKRSAFASNLYTFQETQYTYYINGDLIREIEINRTIEDPEFPAVIDSVVTKNVYKNGELAEVWQEYRRKINPQLNVFFHRYFRDGRKKDIQLYANVKGEPIGQANQVIRYEYDKNDRLVRMVDERLNINGYYKPAFTEDYERDDNGRLLAVRSHTKHHDGTWRHEHSEYEYNPKGQITRKTRFNNAGNQIGSTIYIYDPAGKLLREIVFDENGKLEFKFSTKYSYYKKSGSKQ